jgi:hypothetical protein
VQFQLKTSDDLEIYELEDASKDKLEEICDLRQPVLLDFRDQKIEETCNIEHLVSNYHAFEIKIRNAAEKDCSYLPLQLGDAVKLFKEDTNGVYFSENNIDFLNETGVVKSIQYNDEYLRPYMVSNCKYDIMIGSDQVKTPFRYEVNYRNYFIVTQGTVRIKLSPPKNNKYLEAISDYENFEFRSLINPWITDTQAKYKCLEVILPLGKAIYVPAYWWYSIQFDQKSCLVSCRYRTHMNNIAIIPNGIMYALQNQNLKLNIVGNKTSDLEVEATTQKKKEESSISKENENQKKKEKKQNKKQL